ncbi:MAG: hypothetical protein P8M80_06320 [Pirellulaceae bacterium]|nr:hypothetical protein [Pirellulaceae bacterium]
MRSPSPLFLLLVTILPLESYGQKENPLKSGDSNGGLGIFQSKQEYFEFMGAVKQNPELRPMVSMINDIVLGNPIGATGSKYKGTSSPLGLLNSPAVRNEIEMVDDQYKELQQMSRSIQQRAAGEIRNIDFSNVKNLSTRIRGIQKSMQEDLDDLLLPHQVKRLRQLQTQSLLRTRSLAQMLTSDPVKSDLKITDDQSVELIEAEKEIESELQQQINELRKKAREKLLGKLKSNQREKMEEILGDTFKFDQKNTPSKTNKRK